MQDVFKDILFEFLMSIFEWVYQCYKLFCVVSWCRISWTAIQLYSKAAWMERCLYFNGSSADWRSDHEDYDAECWVQDGADKKEATVVIVSNTAQCDAVFGAVCPHSVLCDVVFILPQTVCHLPFVITVTWLLLCVESFYFICVTPWFSSSGCCRPRTDKRGATSLSSGSSLWMSKGWGPVSDSAGLHHTEFAYQPFLRSVRQLAKRGLPRRESVCVCVCLCLVPVVHFYY